MNPSIIDTYANSFRARLYLHEEGRNTPLRLSQPNDKFSWGVSPENDWLQTGGNEPSLIISFDYHSMEDNVTIDVVGRRTINLRTAANDGQRVTVAATITASDVFVATPVALARTL